MDRVPKNRWGSLGSAVVGSVVGDRVGSPVGSFVGSTIFVGSTVGLMVGQSVPGHVVVTLTGPMTGFSVGLVLAQPSDTQGAGLVAGATDPGSETPLSLAAAPGRTSRVSIARVSAMNRGRGHFIIVQI